MKNILFIALILIFSLHGSSKRENGIKQAYYLFSHGIADTKKQVLNYVKSYTKNGKTYCNDRSIINKPYRSFNYPDATERFWRVNFWRSSFGQENEVNTLAHEYQMVSDKLRKRKCNYGLVLAGMSRGASTLINFLGLHKPTDVKAIILESPFDTVDSVLKHIANRFCLSAIPGIERMLKILTKLIFMEYKETGMQARTMARYIKKDLPILIVCSREDKLVPYWSSVRLYVLLKRSGHKNVHLVVLDHGRHSRLLHEQSGDIYQYAVHAFYKKYDLPHDPLFASMGTKIIN